MKIRDIEEFELRTQLTDNIKLALEFNSQSADTSDIEKLVKQFAGALKAKFNDMDLKDVKQSIDNGLYGEYGSYKWLNARILVTWAKQKWMAVLENKRFVGDEDLDHKRYDVSNSPVGSAIIWKMNRVKLDDWEKIPLKKIAEAIKGKEDMNKFADSYGIELISRN